MSETKASAQGDIIAAVYGSSEDAVSVIHKKVFGYDGLLNGEIQEVESPKPITIGWKAMCQERESMLKELEERHMRLVVAHEKLKAHCNAQESQLSVYEKSSHESLNAELKHKVKSLEKVIEDLKDHNAFLENKFANSDKALRICHDISQKRLSALNSANDEIERLNKKINMLTDGLNGTNAEIRRLHRSPNLRGGSMVILGKPVVASNNPGNHVELGESVK